MVRHVCIGLVAGVLASAVWSCGAAPCRASTCTQGCCDALSGRCQAGTEPAACGSAQGVCLACAASQKCSAGACVASAGGGPGTGGGGTGGGATGGGSGGAGGGTAACPADLGAFCDQGAQCQSGLCNGFTNFPGYCTRACTTTADCPLSTVCSLNSASQRVCTWGDYSSFRDPTKSSNAACRVPAPGDTGAPCSADEQCAARVCVKRTTAAASACSYRCNADADCPTNESCSDLFMKHPDGGVVAYAVCSVR